MINKQKTHRLMVQVTIKQYDWLVKKANQLDLSISQLVRWLLNKKIKDINDIKLLEIKPKEAVEITNELIENDPEWDEMMKECKELEDCNKSHSSKDIK